MARATCIQCGGGINTATLPDGETRCVKCRRGGPRLRRKPVTCTRCGERIMATHEGATCRQCRRIGLRDCSACGGPTHSTGLCKKCRDMARDKTCLNCGEQFTARLASATFCSHGCSNKWHGKARQIRHDDDRRVKRGQREVAAPGLSYRARRELMARWIKQGRLCAYCNERRADTMDHVLPLVRGGTNYEGNLVPACKRCNSAKSGWTIQEWRNGRRLAPMASIL